MSAFATPTSTNTSTSAPATISTATPTKLSPTVTPTPLPPTNTPVLRTTEMQATATTVHGVSIPVVVAGENSINLRAGPGTEFAVIGTLQPGVSRRITGRNSDYSWWQVSTPYGVAWIAAHVVTTKNIDNNIPIVETPPYPVQPTPVLPSISPEAPSSTGPVNHTFSNKEVDPSWWPCTEGQIKGNRDSMIYHSPGGSFYAKTYEGVECFNTAGEAEVAGYRASKR
jgi:uncharacterized protein YraI